jgi:hypothetical protein
MALRPAILTTLRRRRGGSPSAAPRGGGMPGVGFLPELPDAKVSVEIAWAADLAADEATWSWTDVTADVRVAPGISTKLGRADESGKANPAECSIVLTNTSGDYSLGGASRRYPYVRRNTPVRVRVDPGSGPRVVFQGGATGWTPGWDALTGTIPVVSLQASGTLRRLSQGAEPVISPMRRFLTESAYGIAYWPMEVGKYATSIPAVYGGASMTWTGTADLASNSDFPASLSLPATNSSGFYRAQVDPYTIAANNTQSVRLLFKIPSGGLTNGARIMSIIPTGGDVTRLDLVYGAGEVLRFRVYNTAGTQIMSDDVTMGIDGDAGMMSLEFAQSGATAFVAMKFLGLGSTGYGSSGGASASAVLGTVSEIWIDPYKECTGVAVGHLALLSAGSAIIPLDDDIDQVNAFDGEGITGTGGSGRLSRVCLENAIPLAFYSGTPDTSTFSDQAGPQPIDTVLEILRSCEDVEQGVLWDGLSAGLLYTTRRRHESTAPAFTIDAAAGELAEPFSPTDDDQRTRNRWTVSRTNGAEFTVEDTTGPLGTAAVGVYSDSKEIDVYADRGARDLADWLVHAGTVAGYRFPSVTINMRACAPAGRAGV